MKARDIMHPEDAKAIQMIKSVIGCEEIISVFMMMGYETQFWGENIASSVRVNSCSYPQIYALFKEVVATVGIEEPELYIYNDPVINAYTYGETNTFVALSSGLVENMSREELKAVMAHECGHILCKHCLYKTILLTLQRMGHLLKLLHRTTMLPFYLVLQYWNRKSELSADRCGAAVAGEEVYQSALMKLASGLKESSLNLRGLIEQGREYEAFKRSSLWGRMQQEYRTLFYSHPQLCTRALELDKWRHSYAYKQLRK